MGCNYEGAVYVYTGTVTEENLTDLNVTLTGDEAETQPLVVVPVNQDGGDAAPPPSSNTPRRCGSRNGERRERPSTAITSPDGAMRGDESSWSGSSNAMI